MNTLSRIQRLTQHYAIPNPFIRQGHLHSILHIIDLRAGLITTDRSKHYSSAQVGARVTAHERHLGWGDSAYYFWLGAEAEAVGALSMMG